MSELRVESVVIDNIKGVKHVEFKAGEVTVISGKNGVGKTSVLDAMANIFKGGHDPSMIRRGAKVGRVTMALSNGVTIKKSIRPKSMELKITNEDGGLIRPEKEYVDSLVSDVSFDPVLFVEPGGGKTEQRKRRLAYLLDAMPVEFPSEQLREALKDRAPLKPLNLDEFNSLLAGLESQRTDAARDGKSFDGAIERLEGAIPEDSDTDWPAAHEKLLDDISKQEQLIATAASERDLWIEGEKADRRSEFGEKIQKLRDEITDLEKQQAEAEHKAETEGQQLYEDAVAKTRQKVTELKEEAATAAQKAEEVTRVGVLKEELETNRQAAQKKQVEVDDLTLCIDRMRALKKTILNELPIDGVDVRDGNVYVDGTPWEHVNTSEQYIVAAQVSALEKQKLPFKILDRGEQLDDERFEMLAEGYRKAGLQLAVARVTEDDSLTVEAAP